MAKVYIFAGFVAVILLAATYLMVVGRVGLGMFRFRKKKEKDDQATPVADPRRDRGDGGGPGYWV